MAFPFATDYDIGGSLQGYATASKGGVSSSRRARTNDEDAVGEQQNDMHDGDQDQSSGAEYDMSD